MECLIGIKMHPWGKIVRCNGLLNSILSLVIDQIYMQVIDNTRPNCNANVHDKTTKKRENFYVI